jgi:hypothetical protein
VRAQHFLCRLGPRVPRIDHQEVEQPAWHLGRRQRPDPAPELTAAASRPDAECLDRLSGALERRDERRGCHLVTQEVRSSGDGERHRLERAGERSFAIHRRGGEVEEELDVGASEREMATLERAEHLGRERVRAAGSEGTARLGALAVESPAVDDRSRRGHRDGDEHVARQCEELLAAGRLSQRGSPVVRGRRGDEDVERPRAMACETVQLGRADRVHPAPNMIAETSAEAHRPDAAVTLPARSRHPWVTPLAIP